MRYVSSIARPKTLDSKILCALAEIAQDNAEESKGRIERKNRKEWRRYDDEASPPFVPSSAQC